MSKKKKKKEKIDNTRAIGQCEEYIRRCHNDRRALAVKITEENARLRKLRKANG